MVNTSLIQFRALLARQHALQQQHHRRLARKIHDDVNQTLTLLALQLSLATLEQGPPANWTKKCQDWNRKIMELGEVMREISNELRPRVLDDLGLVAALQWFANSNPEGIACQLSTTPEPVTLPPYANNELFSLCREIVTDVFAPNGVTQMAIELQQTADLLRLQLAVRTVKPGSEPLTFQALDGLSIHERLACIDGSAVVDQQLGTGFAVTLSVQSARRPISSAA
jgi:two-component system, NarL family, sensor histidine kinase UhpB